MDLNSAESIILRLPNELLMKVFEFIPDRWNISTVCRRFYEVLCKVEMNAFKLCVKDEETMLNTSTFYSILNSQREFNALKMTITTKTTPLFWNRIERVIAGITVKDLWITCNDPRREVHVLLVNLLTKLPTNTLNELTVINVNLDYIHCLLERQVSVKNLHITGSVGDSLFLISLNLTSLKLIGPKSKNLKRIIEAQPNLQLLQLIPDEESTYDDDVFHEIVKLEKLQTLDFPLNDNLSVESIADLRKLKHLKRLSVSCSQACFQELIKADIPSLIDLDIILADPAANDSLTILAQHIPNLKAIKLKGPLVVNFLNDVAINWHQLESIWIENDESFYVNILSLPSIEPRCLKLKHFTIINHDRKVVICPNHLIKFLKMFAKIETLMLSKFIEIQLTNFEAILRHLPLLREIIFDSKMIKSTTNLMKVISNYDTKLKFILMENFKLETDIESLKVFFGERFPVIEKTNGNLMLRNYEKIYLKNVS